MNPNAKRIEEIPWRRLVHFHGRADNVERAIRQLEVGDVRARTAAVEELRRCLEHQDGVIQATPIAVPFIVAGLLKPNDPLVKTGMIELLAACFASAKFQVEDQQPIMPRPQWEDLLAPDKLWPEYVSDEEDEALWEDAGVVDDVHLWAAVTIDRIVAARDVFERLATSDSDSSVATAAAHLLSQIDQPVTMKSVSPRPATKPWWRFW
jgi:hypothetical protein